MKNPNVLVHVNIKGRWGACRSGSERMHRLFPTKRRAVAFAKRWARKFNVDLWIATNQQSYHWTRWSPNDRP